MAPLTWNFCLLQAEKLIVVNTMIATEKSFVIVFFIIFIFFTCQNQVTLAFKFRYKDTVSWAEYKINDEIFILITESRFILYFSLNIKKQKTIAIFLSVGKFIITNFAANLYKVLNDK